MKLATVIAAALALTGAASAAKAQSFLGTDITAMYNQMMGAQNQQMNGIQNNIVSSNMNNPQVVAMWRANPRGMSLQQYAYSYAATGGFTPQGMAQYNATSQQIAAQDAASLAGYRQAQANFGNAIAQRNASASYNLGQAGLGLMGQQTYYGPGGAFNASYMPNAQSFTQGAYTYRPTGNGGWIAMGPGGSFMVPYR